MKPVRELESQNEWVEAFDLLLELDSTLNRDKFLAVLEKNVPGQIKLFGKYEDSELAAVAVTYVLESIDGDRVLWIFDMVTREANRSKGVASGASHRSQ